MQLLDWAPLWLVGLGIAVILVVAEEIGFRARRLTRRRAPDDEAEEGANNLVGAALALLGLLFAFTFAMAQERFDQRRRLVMEEANAVWTSYLRYQALAEPERRELGRLMRDYAAVRGEAFDPQTERERLDAHVRRTAAIQGRIWDAALRGLRRSPELVEPVMESTNRMFEAAAVRRAMVDARLPATIKGGLLLVAALSAFFTGYGLALDRRHRGPIAALFVLFSLVFLIVLELDRAYSGAIRVSQAPLVRAAESIAAQEAARPGGPAPARP